MYKNRDIKEYDMICIFDSEWLQSSKNTTLNKPKYPRGVFRISLRRAEMAEMEGDSVVLGAKLHWGCGGGSQLTHDVVPWEWYIFSYPKDQRLDPENGRVWTW